MTKQNAVIRGLFAATLAGGTVFGLQCGDLMGGAIKNGIYNYVAGNGSGTGVITQFGNFVTDFFTGGSMGDSSNNNNNGS